jgi:hypothetical protein
MLYQCTRNGYKILEKGAIRQRYILYYVIIPFMIIGGTYLIIKPLLLLRRKNNEGRNFNSTSALWIYSSMFNGLVSLVLGVLIALDIINPPF